MASDKAVKMGSLYVPDSYPHDNVGKVKWQYISNMMKSPIYSLLFMLLALTSSCDLFSAGAHPFAEAVYSDCPRDTIISRLIQLKATGKYDHPNSFSDGKSDAYPTYYYFYFYSREQNCVLLTAVTPGFDKKKALVLVSAKEPSTNSKWIDFNHGLYPKRQEAIIHWFNTEIKPALGCD
ncbi:hypothetical protein F0P96_01785 [Hymenobacter busanensis]|uniref:Uncharacterized protein n=1 Tax=Hymenobacter busanensis TaxID=2607656 RepID=A0A7L4ZVK7_9BACT|nr:hypothetical protein [Hymenobacter busanensis]KAA9339374.1 hypothetical protein F0P96_01785 [Hymenobacter busanensis]QHJ06865.1 hypothetical protein GUY19_05965 [Hymenobacter busanensis]